MQRVGRMRASQTYDGCEEYPDIAPKDLQFMLMAIHKNDDPGEFITVNKDSATKKKETYELQVELEQTEPDAPRVWLSEISENRTKGFVAAKTRRSLIVAFFDTDLQMIERNGVDFEENNEVDDEIEEKAEKYF